MKTTCKMLGIIFMISTCLNCTNSNNNGDDKNKYIVTYYSTNDGEQKSKIEKDSIYETSDSAALRSALTKYYIMLGSYYESVNTTELKNVYFKPDSFKLISPAYKDITNKNFTHKDSVIKRLYYEYVNLNESIFDENERYAEKAKIERENAVKNSLVITSAYLARPNSAGGCDAYFYYKNLSDKTIKYLWWSGVAYNAVGDIVACEIKNTFELGGKSTGPIVKGGKGGGYYDCMIYNPSAKKLKIISVSIKYMDGSTLELKGEELNFALKK